MNFCVPEKPSTEGIETKWSNYWKDHSTYKFRADKVKSREEVYSIDTPPPTVSGSLHIGHVFSYTHTDTIARFKRLYGKKVFYPIGWDDNGLPTERRVQNYYGVKCDPNLDYDENFKTEDKPFDPSVSISRKNFIELCNELTNSDEAVFEELWRYLGLSVDWETTYSTISKQAQMISQAGFLSLLEKGIVYKKEAPTLWDIDFQTAVAQAEIEDREVRSAYHTIRFKVRSSADNSELSWVTIDTTRPELLPACVALVANPDDERYKSLFYKEVISPLFSVPVKVMPHHLAEPDKGTGIAMVCTFGDMTDVVWWREMNLPTRTVLDKFGRFKDIEFGKDEFESRDIESANSNYQKLKGLKVNKARETIKEMLLKSGDLIGDTKPIVHPVKFYEKGDKPLEVVTSRQWYIRITDLKDELVSLGNQINWYPAYMKSRYETWVMGLNSDWCISRQRYFGVAFPVWYKVSSNGTVDFDNWILPKADQLPVDPSVDIPSGYSVEQRNKPGGFTGDLDVMDTWATSSLTPQIAGKWLEDEEFFNKVFPMDLRPQAHDIIRTWLFTTVVRSHLEFKSLPFNNVAISGFVLDPDRKKMSKSKGNVVTPMNLLVQHGSDAIRYWAASGRPGVDTSIDEGQMKVGRRLVIKLLNACKFSLDRVADAEFLSDLSSIENIADSLELVSNLQPIDISELLRLIDVVEKCTDAFVNYDYSKALDITEGFFWEFCDDYLELVKVRSYGQDTTSSESRVSAQVTLACVVDILLRLFAPFLPFVTEEIHSWYGDPSIHLMSWPNLENLKSKLSNFTPYDLMNVASKILHIVRRSKTEMKVSQKSVVDKVVIEGNNELLDHVRLFESDLIVSCGIQSLILQLNESLDYDGFSVDVKL